MSGYVVKINGSVMQWEDRTLEEAVHAIAAAHARGDRWDVRRHTGRGGEQRLLTDEESAELVARVAEEVS
jgi:hypothetical protein